MQSHKGSGSKHITYSYATTADKTRIEEGCLWLFDTSIFVIEPYNGKTKPKDMAFNKASFWMKMHNMPLGGMKFGSLVGSVEVVDVDEEDISRGKWLQVKVRLDLTQPIAWGRTVNIDREKYYIPFQYEKLPKVCFSCGCIIHNPKTCKSTTMANVAKKQFRLWLWAQMENQRGPYYVSFSTPINGQTSNSSTARKVATNVGEHTGQGIDSHIVQGVMDSNTRLEPHTLRKEPIANPFSTW